MEHGQFVVCFIILRILSYALFFIYSLILHRFRIPAFNDRLLQFLLIFFFSQLAWAFFPYLLDYFFFFPFIIFLNEETLNVSFLFYWKNK